MSVRFHQNNNNITFIFNQDEAKTEILKTKIIILLLIGLFSIFFGCLPIFLDRIAAVKNCCLKKCRTLRKSQSNRENVQTTTATNTVTRDQYFDDGYSNNNNNINRSSNTPSNNTTATVCVNKQSTQHQNFHQAIKFLLCFGGGVLFFTSFIHLHPEIREIFRNLEKRKIFTNTISGMGGIQTSELLICCGFFLIYLIEELMHYLITIRELRNNSEFILHRALTKCNPVIFWKKNRNLDNCYHQSDDVLRKRKNDDRNDFLDTYECHFGFDPEYITMDEFSNNCRRDSLPMECPLSSLSSSNYGVDNSQPQSTINLQSMSYVHLHGVQEYGGAAHPLSGSSTTLLMETSSVTGPPIPPLPPQIEFESCYLPNEMKSYNTEQEPKQNRPNAKFVTFSMDQDPNTLSTNAGKQLAKSNLKKSAVSFANNEYNEKRKVHSNFQTVLRGLVAIFALSIHSLFEGLAVGLEKNISSIWYLFLAIGTHKFVIIFCVGIELVASKLKHLWVAIYITGFALVTPLGILIGAIISHSYETSTRLAHINNTDVTSEGILLTVAAMLQALSAGTLLYVIFFEILIKERHHHHHFETVINHNNPDKSDNLFNHLHHSADSLIQCFAVGCGFMFMVTIHAFLSKNAPGHIH